MTLFEKPGLLDNMTTVLFFLLLTLPIYGVAGFGPMVLALLGIPVWFVAIRPTWSGLLLPGLTGLLLLHTLFWVAYGALQIF